MKKVVDARGFRRSLPRNEPVTLRCPCGAKPQGGSRVALAPLPARGLHETYGSDTFQMLAQKPDRPEDQHGACGGGAMPGRAQTRTAGQRRAGQPRGRTPGTVGVSGPMQSYQPRADSHAAPDANCIL